VTTETFTTPAPTPLDHHAILARAEQMIKLLRTRYICDGWHGKGPDEAAAERTLRHFRALASGAPDDDQEKEAAIRFFLEHGQSLDWIFVGDLSGMICRQAAFSARADGLARDEDQGRHDNGG
jgi:hypothetical protein